MADAQKTIDLIFNGVDKTGAATLSALNNAKSFTASLQNVTQPIADFTAGAVKLEAGLLAAGVAVSVFAVKMAGDFDGSFRELSTIIDATDGELAGFKVSIDEYAKGSTQSIEQIMGALAGAVGSGVDWAKSLDLIAVAEKLAVATHSDLDSTTKVLVSTLNSYGLEVKDAGDLSDLFFSIIDKGDIKMSDLSASFAKVAPVAKVAGVSLEDVGAAIAVLTASGITPAEAIESLRAAISNILAPSKEATEQAAALGINFDAAGLKADGLAGLMAKVSQATGGSAEQIKALFGSINGFTAAALLAGPQAEKFAQTAIEMADRAGKTSTAFDIMKLSLENNTKAITNAFEYMMRQIGTPLLDEFGGIARAIAGIFNALGASVKEGGLKDLVTYIEGQFGSIQKALETVAKNLPAALASADFSRFTGGVDAVINALKKMFSSIDITSVAGLKDMIELAGTAFLGLSKYVAGVIEVFAPLFRTLVDVGKGAKEVDVSFLEIIGNLGGIASALNLVLPLFSGLLAILTTRQAIGLIVTLQEMVPVIGTLAAGPFSVAALGTAFAFAGYNLGTALNPHIDAFISKMSGTKTTLGGWIYDLVHGAEETKKLGLSSGDAAAGVGKFGDALSKSFVAWDAAIAVGKLDAEFVKASESSRLAQESFRKSEITVQNVAAASEKAAGGVGKLGDAHKDINTYAMKAVPIFDAATGAITGYEQQLVKSETGTIKLASATDKAGDSLKKTADETKKAEEAAKKWGEEVAKMAHAEKLKLIEAQSKITTAQIEADAKKAVAAYESINTTIDSTGKSLDVLFGLLGGANKIDFWKENKIADQIDKENKRRDDALKLQKDLTEAQIAQMKAQTNALLKGDGLIKIDGAGLKPHLEAFMWEILQAIQVKVNKDGLKMLLGA